jgi:hypothetical protein
MTLKHVSSRRVVATIGLLAVGIALFVPLPMSASSESACEARARWAAEYERTTPVPTLDEIAQFDRAHRVAIFNAVTPDVRASLFQEQLRRFSQRPDLTAAQRALIAEGLTLITPSLYRKEPAASQSFRLFWSRAEPSFTSPDQRRPWMDIGNLSGSSNHGPSALDKPLSASRLNEFCECSAGWQTDCGSWGCMHSDCTYRAGCGPGGGYTCDGICVPLSPAPSLATAR